MSEIVETGGKAVVTPFPKTGQARERAALPRRRMFVFALNALSVLAFLAAITAMLMPGGIAPAEALMIALFALTLPWLSIGFWNAVIGVAILKTQADPAAFVNPFIDRARLADPIRARTAIAMAIRNENPAEAFRRLEAIADDLVATPYAAQFDIHVLSDTDIEEVAASEAALYADWRRRSPMGARLFYRRRMTNEGFKAGNIEEFVERTHRDYDFFLPLDADSAMSGAAILKLVRIMQASPRLGLLQGLVVGSPATTLFTRAFQFGMRHGMRTYTLGSAWWQGDCGPFWGHNALIRMDAFHRHCRLPHLSGTGPLAGAIMSHDQVEAVLMRRGGYQCRVLAEEDESFEDNPPSVPDFIKREVRWCQGNMQYLRLLAMPGLRPVSRWQLALAILMYAGAPAWVGLIALGTWLAVTGDTFTAIPLAPDLTLFAAIMLFNLMPKIMGVMETASTPEKAARYGGRTRVILGGLIETGLSMLIAPIVAVTITLCCAFMLVGRKVAWKAQQRARDRLDLDEAIAALWPQTATGLILLVVLASNAPWALAFTAPVIAALLLSVPLAVLTASPPLGRLSQRLGLFDIPEERRHVGLSNLNKQPIAEVA